MIARRALTVWLPLFVLTMPAQQPMPYQNSNTWDYAGLAVRSVSGIATDAWGPVNGAQVGIFTEPGHELVAETVANDSGEFRLVNIPKGLYRLVVATPGLCPANVRVQVVSWPRGGFLRRRELVAELRPGAIDVCSFVRYR